MILIRNAIKISTAGCRAAGWWAGCSGGVGELGGWVLWGPGGVGVGVGLAGLWYF